MTTAHRPTWKAAVGRANEGGYSAISTQRSALDNPAHTKLKVRKGIQAIASDKEELIRTSLAKLERAEAKLQQLKRYGIEQAKKPREIIPEIEAEGRLKLLKNVADVDDEAIRQRYDDADEVIDVSKDMGANSGWSDVEDAANGEDGTDLDASDDSLDDDDESGDSGDFDDDDSDEEAALQAELDKIRAEREAAKVRKEAEEHAEEQLRLEEAALVGNPLLNDSISVANFGSGGARLKRKWNDDVVFRNQARGEPDAVQKRFINDTVRNDFHKRFLNKFIH